MAVLDRPADAAPRIVTHGLRTERRLMKGNEAIAEAAIAAGCDAYFGYPITPQAELLEWMARRMPEEGRVFVQAESELAAINMALGAGAAGARVLVSSSSPGISLMAETMSYMAGSRIPCVLINVMRGGPGLGSIGAAQGDYLQATKGHGHGDYHVPVLAPSSIGEAIELVSDAFVLAERYRTPVMILADGILGQAMEPVEPEFPRLAKSAADWTIEGADGREPRVVRSLHLQPEDLEAHNDALQATYREIVENEPRWAGELLEDAEVVVVAYGTAARVARTAVERAREGGIRAGLFRPVTLWPFPVGGLRAATSGARAVLTVEMSAGQLVEDVRLALEGALPVYLHGRTGGMVPSPDAVLEAIRAVRAGVPLPAGTGGGPMTAPAVGRLVYERPALLSTKPTSYCPGCGHGIVHRVIAEVLGELGLGSRTILVGSVGCSVFAYDYLRLDAVESPHGRAAAVATGVKRYRPDRVVFTYQGDGDLAAIGTAEIVHAAARGERFTTIFVNNGIYGMTGGQMAPTTLAGQKTTSSPLGRDPSVAGYPLPVTEMLSLLPGVAYAARTSVADAGHIGKMKTSIRRAFEVQLEGAGFSIVEVLSTCPVGWGMTPTEAMERLATEVTDAYPIGTFVDRARGIAPRLPVPGSLVRSVSEGF